MKSSSRFLFLALAAIASIPHAVAQNNGNNLDNMANNASEERKPSTKNSSNNVLDVDEMNGSNNLSNLSEEEAREINEAENIFNSNQNTLNENANFKNNANSQQNNPNAGKNNLNNQKNPKNGQNNANQANGNGNLANPSAPPAAVNNFGLGNTSNTNFNTAKAASTNSAQPPTAGANAPTPEAPPAQPPVNAATLPGASDSPPTPEVSTTEPGTTPSEPEASEGQQSPQVDPQKLSRAEKRKLRLELTRKMAESIPPLAPGEGPLEYIVQPGDTLWDISDQLLDDAMWWPRLWVLNPDVEDPHKIEPGMRLVFYPSAAGSAPELGIRDAVDPFGAPKVELSTLQTFDMKTDRHTLKNGEILDPSNVPADNNLLISGEPVMNATYAFKLPGFISQGEVQTVGQILSNPNIPLIGGQGQTLIARFEGNLPQAGERFVALRHTSIVAGLEENQSDLELYNYSGVVGVLRNSADGLTLLVAEDPHAHISPTDLLIPLNRSLMVPIQPESAGRPNPQRAVVVATDTGAFLNAGPGVAVFLRGIDGENRFAVGDDVDLFMPIGGSFGFGQEVTPREKVAVARVVEANRDAAVAVILKASREVSSGATTYPDPSY